jgi:hypothetical protein
MVHISVLICECALSSCMNLCAKKDKTPLDIHFEFYPPMLSLLVTKLKIDN